MAATAYTATIKVVGADGWTYAYPITASDIAAAFWIFPDGSSDIVLPSTHGAISIVDIVQSASGVDTKNTEVYVAGTNTGIKINGASVLGTNFSRQLMGSPIVVGPGARVKFTQVA